MTGRMLEDMVRCMEPEVWATVPDWDAPDEVIEQYLEHLNACPYHAEFERRRTDAVQLTFDAARSVAHNGTLTFSDQEEAAALDTLARLDSFHASGAQVSALRLKANGQEIGTLDFANGRKLKTTFPRRQPLQIYGLTGAGEPELLLATYVPAAQDRPGSYPVTLNGKQSLRLDVRPARGAKIQLTISCTVEMPQRQGLLARFGSGGRLIPVLGVPSAAILLIGIGIVIFRYVAKNRTGNEIAVYTARNDQPNYEPSLSPGMTPQPTPQPPQATPSNSTTDQPPGVRAERPPGTDAGPTPTATPVRTSGGLRSGGQRVEEITSLRNVHKLFIDEQADEFGQVLRSAVIKRLDELGFITRVTRAESDARLRLKWESGNRVAFSILSGDTELLNFRADYADPTPAAADALALKLKARVQAKLK